MAESVLEFVPQSFTALTRKPYLGNGLTVSPGSVVGSQASFHGWFCV